MYPLRLAPLPELFYDSETGEPFTHCLNCEQELLNDGPPYLIEKAVRSFDEYDVQEVVFEYAMCMSCYEEISKSFSETSRQRIEAYFAEHLDFQGRTQRIMEADEAEVEAWTAHCAVTDTPREALSEYQLVAHAHGEQLVLSHLPCLISGEAMDEVAELLSQQTRDSMGGFMDEFFGLPPELKRSPQDPVPLAL